jgi:hypothetical protein
MRLACSAPLQASQPIFRHTARDTGLFVAVCDMMKWTQMAVPSHPYTTGGVASCTSTIRSYFQTSSMCCAIPTPPYQQSVLHGLSNISYNHHQAYQQSQSPYLPTTDSRYKVYLIHQVCVLNQQKQFLNFHKFSPTVGMPGCVSVCTII